MALDARLHVRTDAQSNRHLAPTAPCPAIVSLLLDLQCWKPTLRSPSQLHTERVRPAHRCTFAADSIEFLDGSEQLADLPFFGRGEFVLLSASDRFGAEVDSSKKKSGWRSRSRTML
jgi:hypothetical protein